LTSELNGGDLNKLESDMGSMLRDLNGLENEGGRLDPAEATKK